MITIKKADDKPWLGEKVDNRRLSELRNKWHDFHGRQLTKPEQRMAKLTMDKSCHGRPCCQQDHR
ncbi:hypothetical protein [Shewanella sp. YLB-07]|uniref:phage integrase n=1 Tax=Shewanella sp. YLB-07 TaxID=2601268 RepID=UPI0018848C1C|nr:hypothetical protein [Shewanella sp. YLB-07]